MEAQLVDQAADGRVELSRGNDLGDEAESERLGRDPAPTQDHVLCPPESDEPCEPLSAAAPGDHPDRHLGEADLG